MFRRSPDLEVFLVHPGGPFFAKKDLGAWSVPKGLFEGDETALETACREFREETGQGVADCVAAWLERGGGREAGAAAEESCPEFIELGSVVQKGGKRVFAWAFEGEWPEGAVLESNTCTLSWPKGTPPRPFPEVDEGRFFGLEVARQKMNSAQVELIERLQAKLDP